jgi:DNA repair protein RadD
VIGEVDGELEEVDQEAVRRARKQEQGMAQTLDDLVNLATARGYKSPEKWAAHIYSARQAKTAERYGDYR